METVGVSPKVKLPAGVMAGVGVVLLVLGYVLGDAHIQDVAWSLVAASPVAGFLGYKAKPGTVVSGR
jgi:hypothetical protein